VMPAQHGAQLYSAGWHWPLASVCRALACGLAIERREGIFWRTLAAAMARHRTAVREKVHWQNRAATPQVFPPSTLARTPVPPKECVAPAGLDGGDARPSWAPRLRLFSVAARAAAWLSNGGPKRALCCRSDADGFWHAFGSGKQQRIRASAIRLPPSGVPQR
jgi:hypothetical protein